MVALPNSTGIVLLNILKQVKCGPPGSELSSIRLIIIPQHKSKAFIVMIVIAGIGIFVSLCIYFFDLRNLIREVNPSEIIYTTFFTLGVIVGYIGVIFWALYPINTSVCLARQKKFFF
jgi:uncharacterized membrane protein YfcA